MKQCIIDTTDKEVVNKLNSLGYKCYSVIPSNNVSKPICRHSDTLYLKIDKNTFIISECQIKNKSLLENEGYKVIIYDKLKPGYKTESFLNFIINDKYVIRNTKTSLILNNKYLTEIKVKQGYTRCSTICINSGAYITDDDNIYERLEKNNLDCIKLSKGDILLDGYEYGFIGGSCVLLNENEILFFGDISNKKDKNLVVEFLSKYNINAIFIEGKKLVDLGSAIIF